MRSWKTLSLSFFGLLLVVTVVLVALGLVVRDFLVDLWWFQSLGYEFYYWQRLLYRYLVFTVAAGFFFALFFANFWIGSKYLGAPRPRATVSESNDPTTPTMPIEPSASVPQRGSINAFRTARWPSTCR